MSTKAALIGRDRTAVAARVTTGSVAASGFANVVCTLPVAMSSTAYTVTASVEDSNGDLQVRAITARTTTDVTVRVQNTNALNARTGTVHVLAQADA